MKHFFNDAFFSISNSNKSSNDPLVDKRFAALLKTTISRLVGQNIIKPSHNDLAFWKNWPKKFRESKRYKKVTEEKSAAVSKSSVPLPAAAASAGVELAATIAPIPPVPVEQVAEAPAGVGSADDVAPDPTMEQVSVASPAVGSSLAALKAGASSTSTSSSLSSSAKEVPRNLKKQANVEHFYAALRNRGITTKIRGIKGWVNGCTSYDEFKRNFSLLFP